MKNTDMLFVSERVNDYYRNKYFNCAKTTLLILAEKFEVELQGQILDGAIGLNGAGQYRAQCGLAEGVLIFLEVYLKSMKLGVEKIQKNCNLFAHKFETKFGSLSCRELRPSGFQSTDPPFICQDLSMRTIGFAIDFAASV